jgi:drug/metabolite transporter (DMT)-like permease
MAAVFLGEDVGARRIVGSLLVFAGVAAVAVG